MHVFLVVDCKNYSNINTTPSSHRLHAHLQSDTFVCTHKDNGHSQRHNACGVYLYLSGHTLYIMLQVSVGLTMCAEYHLPSK